jgi:hypothetical protein
MVPAVVGALACASGALAYAWPVKPFDKQHPIRGYFGDPRTVFELSASQDGIYGPGTFGFHNGIDIAAKPGTRVYPIYSGTAHLLPGSVISVSTPSRGVTFQYIHLRESVRDGQHVVARRTILGHVAASAGHVHLTEIDGDRVTNPLLPGHLSPYRDKTRPVVEEIELRTLQGQALPSIGICGRIALTASAFDLPAMPVPGPWFGLPVAPALVEWKLTKAGGETVVPLTIAADFRFTVPPNIDFWTVYARGTYQNMPRIGRQQFSLMPGQYIFTLAPELDVRKQFGAGVYQVTVSAVDTRGNAGSLARRFSVPAATQGCTPTPPKTPTTP